MKENIIGRYLNIKIEEFFVNGMLTDEKLSEVKQLAEEEFNGYPRAGHALLEGLFSDLYDIGIKFDDALIKIKKHRLSDRRLLQHFEPVECTIIGPRHLFDKILVLENAMSSKLSKLLFKESIIFGYRVCYEHKILQLFIEVTI